MSESVIESGAAETGAVDVQEAPKPKPTETVDFWKSKAREQEARAKANADAAAKLQQLEDASKTEAQKLAERAETAERKLAEIEARAVRLEVAAEKGLTPKQAARLIGTTREELEADADDLLATFQTSAPAEPASVPSMDLGPKRAAPLALNGDPLEQALRKTLGI